MIRVVATAAALLLLPGAAIASGPELDEHEVEFVRLLNEYRKANGLGCVSVSPTANRAAAYMSQAMGEVPFFDHSEPPCSKDGCTGRDPFERMVDFGHDGWTTAGENIAAGSDTAAAVFQGWKNSPGHNANMLRDGFTAIGIARVVVPGSPYRVYWTNTFSNYVDGTHDCAKGAPRVGDDGSGGGGGGGEDGGGDDGRGGGGCSQAATGLSWFSFALSLLALGRLRHRRVSAGTGR